MAQRGAILFICDAPSSLDFGIDCMSYETGPKFRGVSLIPPGLHFVYYSTGLGSRQGFFFFCEHNELIVRSWDTANEEITAANVLSEDTFNELSFSIQQGHLNHQLGPYPFAQHNTWVNLTSKISMSVLQRTECTPGNIIIPGSAEDMESTPGSSATMTALKPYFPGLGRIARFSDIKSVETMLTESLNKISERTRELTSLNMDKSRILKELVTTYFDQNWNDLLGETQLAFLLFLLLFSHPALVYWKSVVHLISCSENAMKCESNFTRVFLKCLHSQLNFSPTDFFDIELSRDNFLRPTLSALFSSLSGNDVPVPLPEYIRRLFKFVTKKFNLYDRNSCEISNQGDDSYNLVDDEMPNIVSADDAQVSEDKEDKNWSINNTSLNSDNISDRNTPTQLTLQDGFSLIKSFSSETSGDNSSAAQHHPDAKTTVMEMSRTEIEKSLFSWRYPLLYQELCASSFKEDLIMTAVRILDDVQINDECRNEAVLFLENECTKMK